MTWALDLDGVVWLGDKVIQGVGESITFLREKGEQVFFVTNNSGRTVSEVEEKLSSFNIEPNGGVITSAMAMATLLSPDETVLTLCHKRNYTLECNIFSFIINELFLVLNLLSLELNFGHSLLLLVLLYFWGIDFCLLNLQFHFLLKFHILTML